MDDLLALFSPSCDDKISSQKCKILAKKHNEAVALELVSVSEFSPKTVGDHEVIARQVFSPIHVEDDNSIKPAAFDDITNKGLSVNRLELIETSDVHLNGFEKERRDNSKAIESGHPEKANRSYLGYIQARVEMIRSFYHEDVRIYTVYDSSLEIAKEHADVCMVKQNTSDTNVKWVKMFRRKKLQEMFSSLLTPI